MLKSNPDERFSFNQVANHPYLKDAFFGFLQS
jgi:hypothetical protein